ncbi:MAG: outer membrane lipoprotein-sorting protein [Pseudomonadales bacterium]|nr:outer membrane lipoprotein-sorting protein [Pseudomonadales bacterium]NIX09568.1 outer membrane lipoprotein-sorting protein [Pseudomonadales bacterium]
MSRPTIVVFAVLVPLLWGIRPAAAVDLKLDGLTAEESGRTIFEAADQLEDGYADMQVDLEMVLRGRGGSEVHRQLRIKQLEVPEDGDKLLVVFDTPKPIKGTALLSVTHKRAPDDQWLYLPAMKRVKKIASQNKSGPFLSSEFAYEDLTVQEVEKFGYRFLGEDKIDGSDCFVVERTPLDDFSGYSRQQVWIDQDELRVLRIEYFDRRDSLLKTLTIDQYARYEDQFWKAGRMYMTNHQTDRSTELFWRNYRFRTGLMDERDFSTNSLLRVR